MEEYLSSTINKLKSNNYSELNLVIGNESCDLDSAVSALVYATFLHWQYSQIKCKACTGKYRDDSYKDDIFVPILDVERNDYPIKTEVTYCFKKHGIDENNLCFRDDINIQQLLSNGKINVILVDHHCLSRKYEFLSPYVTEIIDHRPVVNMTFNDIRSTIQTVGSCCTLVTQRIRDLANLVAKDVDFFKTYPVTAELLLGVILLDTVNFSKEVDKATPLDEEIVLYLECFTKPQDYQRERSAIVSSLLAARSDASSLTASQLLRKDAKILGHVLIPSLPILARVFLRAPDAVPCALDALRAARCSVALVLGMEITDRLRRDGAVVAASEDAAARLFEFLSAWSKPPLGLSRGPSAHCIYFEQTNLSASRKQYMPAILQYIQDNK